MFDKLRWKLTLFNTAVTGLILVGMIALSLGMAQNNAREQARQSFRETVDTLASYVQLEDALSDGWLRQMEQSQGILTAIWDGGRPLFSLGLSQQRREHLPEFRQARDQAEGSLSLFPMEGQDGRPYYAGVAQVRKQNVVTEVVVLRDMGPLEERLRRQQGLIALGTALGVLLLGGFSWVFTGRMLRPIQENQRRQASFVAAASHELRTPLAAILSAASAMEVGDRVERAQFSQMIRREGQRMTRLIGDMLTLASSDSGSWRMRREEVELDMLVLEAYEAQQPLARQQGLQLVLTLYDQEIPPLMLDRDRMAQVISILLDNARQATQAPGRVELELLRQGRRVRISVADTGPGVADEDKVRIFDRFYRGEQSRSDRGHFGLGLSVAASIVKAHQGRLWVEDNPGGGAKFILELPCPPLGEKPLSS